MNTVRRVSYVYTSPGFIVGIPTVPFIMPFLFGVVLLRRAGEESNLKKDLTRRCSQPLAALMLRFPL
jgi:hypothetical protein